MIRTKPRRFGGVVTTAILSAAIGIFAAPTNAGSHWWSTVDLYTNSGQKITVNGMNQAQFPNRAKSSLAVFNLVISLEDDPQGDDDAKVDSATPDDAAQIAYEERIKEFANAVYEMSNGAHKIGRVLIYRNYDQKSLADVQWEKDCTAAEDGGPWATGLGYQKTGSFIHMCTTWDGDTTLEGAKPSGYTLAHEWGHYGYSLADEYAEPQCKVDMTDNFGADCPAWQPRATDTVSDTIMHSQWFAAFGTVRAGYGGNSSDYLELSTPDHEPFKTPLQVPLIGRNGQERYFGKSAWEVLTSDPANDPTWPDLDRTQYTTLAAPSAPNWRVVNGTAGAQSELDIRWVSDQVAELLIDISGSMSGSPLTNAKLGANVLIAQMPEGDAALGVGSFETDVFQNFAITDIPDPDTGVKAGATAAVNALAATGVTSLYDGLIFALGQVESFQTTSNTTRESVVYVLSDGGDNDSTADEADVIAAYQAAGVPIVAFGYGFGAPGGTLAAMAAATGGTFLQSPTTAAAITAALLSANASFSGNVLIGSVQGTVAPGTPTSQDLPIDGTLDAVTVNASYSGALGAVTFRLLDPSGADTGATFDCTGATSCTAQLDSAKLAAGGTGIYKIEATNTTSADIDVSAVASGSPKAGQGYDVVVSVGGGTQTTYPEPMLVQATVRSTTPITGLNVVATVAPPFGTPLDITLLDDGLNGDSVADDGTYTGSYHYTANGTHTITVVADNAKGQGQTTTEGAEISLFVDGSLRIPAPRPVGENFTRTSASANVTASVTGDDHASSPLLPNSCTTINDDNSKIQGRIDTAGDVDCFFFTPSSTASALVARVTGLSGGMKPKLRVYNSDGTSQLLEVDLATSENDNVGTVVTIPASNLLAGGHVITVEHTDSTAAAGNYRVSLGAAQTSDTKQQSPTAPPVVPTSSGGAIGPWSVFVLAFLGLIGLRQRRR